MTSLSTSVEIRFRICLADNVPLEAHIYEHTLEPYTELSIFNSRSCYIHPQIEVAIDSASVSVNIEIASIDDNSEKQRKSSP